MVNRSERHNPRDVARIIYKEIADGDVRKINADSNDAKTGGGARDFRFGAYDKVAPFMEKLFPEVQNVNRKRNGQQVGVEIRRGRFYWYSGQKEESKEVEFEPPTTARSTEGRITRVHEQPCFDQQKIPPFSAGNKVLLLLVQCHDGTVWPYFIEESSLNAPGAWDSRVAKTILACINAKRALNRVVIGYRDFVTGGSYCNGN